MDIGGNIMKTIESKRLLIREWHEDDANDLFEAKQKTSNFLNYLNFSTVNDSLDIIKVWTEYQEMYPVILKETGKLIGVVGLVDINRYKGYRELEVHICDQYNDVDHLLELHKLILDYGFNELGLLVAFAYCNDTEPVLQKAMIQAGFSYEGTLRKFGRDMSDQKRYSILKEEYHS